MFWVQHRIKSFCVKPFESHQTGWFELSRLIQWLKSWLKSSKKYMHFESFVITMTPLIRILIGFHLYYINRRQRVLWESHLYFLIFIYTCFYSDFTKTDIFRNIKVLLSKILFQNIVLSNENYILMTLRLNLLEQLWTDKGQDVVDYFQERTQKQVWTKCFEQCFEQWRLHFFLCKHTTNQVSTQIREQMKR